MSQKDHEEMREILRKQREKVRSSKKAARELLDSLGMLTPGGDLKRCFKPKRSVSR